MKSSYRRSGRAGALITLVAACALGCAPAVNIGDLPQASSGGTTSGGSSSGDPPASGQACGAITTLASGLNYPASMAISGDALYLLTSDPQATPAGTGLVLKISLAGGDPVVLASGQGTPQGIAADATHVYWSTEDTVKSMPLGGGPVTVIASGQPRAGGIALDATSVYWGNRFDGRVMKAPLGGGAATTLFAPGASGVVGVLNVTVDAESVYWSATGEQLGSGSVMKAPLDGGAATTLVSGLSSWGALAVDEGHVYWTDDVTLLPGGKQGPGTVWKLPLDGSAEPVLLATQNFPGALAVDATTVYWGGGTQDSTDKALSWPTAVSLDSSAGPQAIFSSVISDAGLVACPGGVCWTDAATGKVMRYVACSP